MNMPRTLSDVIKESNDSEKWMRESQELLDEIRQEKKDGSKETTTPCGE